MRSFSIKEHILVSSLLLVFSLQLFSQTSKVQGEYIPTPEEIRESERKLKLEREIAVIEKGVNNLMGKLNLNYGSASTFFLHENHTKKELNKILKRNKSLLTRANNAQFFSKCGEIRKKYSQLGKEIGTPCSWLKKIRKIANKNVNTVNTGIANIGKKKKKTASKINKINKDINELDNALVDINKKKNQNKKTIKAYNAKYKEKSIDDFLKNNLAYKKKGKNNDFLSASTSNKKAKKKKNNDFLSGVSKPPKFSDGDAYKGYKVDYKQNGTYGVIDISGNILIPYKKWQINEYKNGIAKVSIEIDRYSNPCSSKAYGSVSGYAYKTGFVDKSASFIDGYKITFAGGFNNRYTGLVLQRGTDNRSEAEKKASKRRAAKRRRLARKECEAKLDEWKTGIINRYK